MLKIVDARVKTDYTWADISGLDDWSSVRNTNVDWSRLTQTTTVGRVVKIEVEISEGTWNDIKANHSTWQRIKDKFTSWLGVKNY